MGRPVSPAARRLPTIAGMVSASASSATICGTVPGNRSGASRGRSLNAARWRSGRSEGRRMAAPVARPAASIAIVALPAMGSTRGSVRASQRDNMISCAAIVSRSGAGPPATRAPRRCRAPPPMSMPITVRRAPGVPARRTTNTTSGESASTSDATLRDAKVSTIAFLTTPRSWSGDASKSNEGPTSTEKRRDAPPGSLSSDESAGRRSSKSGSRRTAVLEHRSQEIRDDVR